MTVRLLDANLLIALAWPNHVHHDLAHRWYAATARKSWATCPLTQLAFVRISSNAKIIPAAVPPREAMEMLRAIMAQPGHHFWPDTVDVTIAVEFASLSLVGHRQVTDAYLISLARSRKGRLATLDRGVSELLADSRERDALVETVA